MADRHEADKAMTFRCAALTAGLALAVAALLGACASAPAAGAKGQPEPAAAGSAPSSPPQQPAATAKGTAPPNAERVQIPDDMAIFQDYLDTIQGRLTGPADTATIKATVLSVTRGTVCPDKREPSSSETTTCSVEPYPKDVGVIRIDAILSYAAAGSGGAVVEGRAGQQGTPAGGGATAPGNQGIGAMVSKPYQPLQAGQEVPALFVLSARPAKARQAPLGASAAPPGSPGAPEGGTSEQPVARTASGATRAARPLRVEGGALVFTTQFAPSSQPIEQILPGLQAGDKLTASIRYNGTAYVSVYEKP